MSSALRQCRNRLQLSQREFADRLGVAAETCRTWESGRRPAPAAVVTRARLFSGCPDDRALLPLRVLASMIGVHVATLRAAARDGRLAVVYDTRTTFRQLRPRATLADVTEFRRVAYGKRLSAQPKPPAIEWGAIPVDYDLQIRALRRRLGISQAQCAALLGAARKAVVYQWEARKRCPSPVFWARIQALIESDARVYCSEARLAFNRTVDLRYRIHLEQLIRAAGDDQPEINSRALMCISGEIADCGHRRSGPEAPKTST